MQREGHGPLRDYSGLGSGIINTGIIPDITNLQQGKEQIQTLRDCYFILARSLSPEDSKGMVFSHASLETVTGRIGEAIASRQKENLAYYLDMFHLQTKREYYTQNQVIWHCEEIVSSAIKDISAPGEERLRNLRAALSYITKLSLVHLWLSAFKDELSTIWNDCTNNALGLTDKAKLYIASNIRKRLYLTEVADFINVSPGYLSTVFSRQCGMSVVEYINKAKTEEAMRIIRKGPAKIGDVGATLGFENSYYFSKVFKKYAHISPSDYQKKVHNQE